LWLDNGDLIGFVVGPARTHLEAVFQLLRLPAGRFSFDIGPAAPLAVGAVPLLGLLDGALARLKDWSAIQVVVPSLASIVRLTADLPGSEASIAAMQWRVVAAVGRASSVAEILGWLDCDEFDGCRMIKELVEIGALSVEHRVDIVARSSEPVIDLVEAVAALPNPVYSQDLPTADPIKVADEVETNLERAMTTPIRGADTVAGGLANSNPALRDGFDSSGTQPEMELPRSTDTGTGDVGASRTLVAESDPEPISTDNGPEPIGRAALLKLLSSMRS